MEIFAGTIKDSSTKSEVNPFQLKTVPNWILDRFSRTIGKISTQNESGSFPLDCWLSPLFGERKSISDQASNQPRLDFYIGSVISGVLFYHCHINKYFSNFNNQPLYWTFTSEGVRKTYLSIIQILPNYEQCISFQCFVVLPF